MKTIIANSILLLVLLSSITSAREIRKETINLSEGENSISLRGEVKGYDVVDYQLEACAGEKLNIVFESSNLSAYFNVLPPDSSDTAIFIGSISGNRYETELPSNGIYTIRVYMMRSAARRNETANYTLKLFTEDMARAVEKKSSSNLEQEGVFDRTFELQNVSFHITSANNSSINTVMINPSELEIDNSPIIREVDGTVTDAEVADLNADNSPEIYIYVTSAGSGSYGSLVAYSANNHKSLSEIYLPSLTEKREAAKGYMGHDEFAVLEGVLGRRFPIYNEGDSNSEPTGGMRQLQYKLVKGEAGWLLELDRITDF